MSLKNGKQPFYGVFRYVNFPKRDFKDVRVRVVTSIREVQDASIRLNKKYESRFYWRLLEPQEYRLE